MFFMPFCCLFQHKIKKFILLLMGFLAAAVAGFFSVLVVVANFYEEQTKIHFFAITHKTMYIFMLFLCIFFLLSYYVKYIKKILLIFYVYIKGIFLCKWTHQLIQFFFYIKDFLSLFYVRLFNLSFFLLVSPNFFNCSILVQCESHGMTLFLVICSIFLHFYVFVLFRCTDTTWFSCFSFFWASLECHW